MKILLDTHIWLWMNQAPERISRDALEMIEDNENQLYLSAASSWEIALKYQQGRLNLPMVPDIYIPKRMAETQILALPIVIEHTLVASSLPNHHKDPFDRILIAQSLLEDMPLMTCDEKITQYQVNTIYVG